MVLKSKKNVIFWILLFSCNILFFSGTQFSIQEAKSIDNAEIDTLMNQSLKKNLFMGINLGIINENETVLMKSYLSNSNPTDLTNSTPMLIGSLSKSFTATGIMILAEEGRIDLDTPIQTYLPTFTIQNTSNAAIITVRHLLHHTSGINQAAGLNAPKEVNNIDKTWNHISSMQFPNPPGSRFEYSNTNYQLLGSIIEHVSGQTFAEFIQTTICTPLGMNHTFFDQKTAESYGYSPGYRIYCGIPVKADLEIISAYAPSGFIFSTVTDMSIYLKWHISNGLAVNNSILLPINVQSLHEPPVTPSDTEYAMGWDNSTIDGISVLLHAGQTESYSAYMLISPQNGLGFIILCQSNQFFASGNLENLAFNLFRILIEQSTVKGPLDLLTLYIIMDFAIIILLGLEILSFFKIEKRFQKLINKTDNKAPKKKLYFKSSLSLLNGILLGAFPFIFPMLGGFPAIFFFNWIPDLCFVVLLFSVLNIVKGIGKFITAKKLIT